MNDVPECEDKSIAWFTGLPEWLRWLLFLPVSIVLTTIVALLVKFAMSSWETGGWDILDALIFPAVIYSIFLMAIYFTVPRAKKIFLAVFIVVRSVLLLLFISLTLIGLLDLLPELELSREFTWWDWWAPFIGEVIVLFASLGVWFHLKDLESE